jgi:tRNA threonylcarbamoyladenosine modification (KEOPS) complex  Pcc1 subunit
MLEANITLKYPEEEIAKAIAEAVSPDNIRVPEGLEIRMWRKERKVLTKIKLTKNKLPTFIATIEDFLRSVSVAEKTVFAIKKTSGNYV